MLEAIFLVGHFGAQKGKFLNQDRQTQTRTFWLFNVDNYTHIEDGVDGETHRRGGRRNAHFKIEIDRLLDSQTFCRFKLDSNDLKLALILIIYR